MIKEQEGKAVRGFVAEGDKARTARFDSVETQGGLRPTAEQFQLKRFDFLSRAWAIVKIGVSLS